MAYETILVERIGRVTKITLNRPEVMNCINAMIWQEIGTAFEEFAQDPQQWVAVLTGAGERAFCAGADLKAVSAGQMVITEQMQAWGFAGIARHFVNKPVIAAVNGFALGGGTEIALACDLVVASEKASFGLPEVKRGIIAGAGGLLRLPRQVPLKVAMHCIMTGEPLTATEAHRWGLVNLVVAHDQVVPAAMAMAEKICQNAPVAVRASKEIVYRGLDAPLDFPGTAWEINKQHTSEVMTSEDAKEGPRAFAEKRAPNWVGR
jgi:crotonobetainyl-CoA hydratase